MCRIFATQDPASYALVSRALRLNGHTTSIRLEAAYWTILGEIAANEGLTTPRFIGKLYDEVLLWHGEVRHYGVQLWCRVDMAERLDRGSSDQRRGSARLHKGAQKVYEVSVVVHYEDREASEIGQLRRRAVGHRDIRKATRFPRRFLWDQRPRDAAYALTLTPKSNQCIENVGQRSGAVGAVD